MNTTCPRCGSLLRPGHSPASCEHCRDRRAGGEDSGLIDIRSLSRMLGDTPTRPVTPLPTFGGLAPVALRGAEAPTAKPPAPRARPSQTPLHILLGVLVFGVVGLGGAVVHSANRSPEAAPMLDAVSAPEITPTPVAAPAEPIEVATKSAEPEPEAAPEPAHKPSVDGPRKHIRSAARPAKAEPTKAQAQPEPVIPKPAKSVDDRELMDCLMDKSKCAAKPGAPASPSPAPVTTAGSDLPAKLEPADISDGTRAAKASATSRCAALAKGGEAIKIKLSITGPTGAVLSTSPEADAGNPSLAACCATELKAAQFRSVQKAQMGAVVTLKF